MSCLIEYQGREVRVTPDTAADLVDRGLARLLEGALGGLPQPETAAAPAAVEPPSTPVSAKRPAASRRKR